jgi:hypothetical protein
VTEVDVEKVKGIVSSFARQAVNGSPCKYVSDGVVIPACYLLDRELDNLTVVATGEAFEQILTAPLTAVEDIYSFSDQGSSAFTTDAFSDLDVDARNLLVMVRLRSSSVGAKKVMPTARLA